jgi:hypothetical protein
MRARYTANVSTSRIAPRIRWAGLLFIALIAHLLVLLVLAAQLPTPASAAATGASVHEAHSPISDGGSGPDTPIVDFTPLVEVLEAPPALDVPRVLQLALEDRGARALPWHGANLDDVRSGRAPPAR